MRDEHGRRPVYGGTEKFQSDPHWRDHILFYEYFHGDNGAGLGASHQTGWTGLVAKLIQLYGLLDAKRFLEVGKQAAFNGATRAADKGGREAVRWPQQQYLVVCRAISVGPSTRCNCSEKVNCNFQKQSGLLPQLRRPLPANLQVQRRLARNCCSQGRVPRLSCICIADNLAQADHPLEERA